MPKSIAIIPARGGSKRIPRKNIKDFFGKPLIAYSIQTALKSKLFDKVVVSTDDEQIAKIAKEYGAEVLKRPKELADDFTGTGDVTSHALSAYTGYEFACTIYATAPMLDEKYLVEGLEKLQNSDAVNAFSATSMPFPIQRTFKLKDGRCEMFTPEYYLTRSQDLEEAYQDAGQFYWERVGIESDKIMFGKDSIPVILPRYLVQDIDTLEDWDRAELMYEVLQRDRFDEWNSLKKKIDKKENILGFREQDVLFLSVGQNIGFEVYGKDKEFLRPVLVLKKLGTYSFIGIPLTKTQRDGKYFYNFQYKKNIKSCAMLNQIRTFDARRTRYKSGKISKIDFKNIQEELKSIIYPTQKD